MLACITQCQNKDADNNITVIECRILTLILLLLLPDARCLKNVRLEIIPEAVEQGHEATLRCFYELEEAPLYSLKWYRGHYEFYRFSPSENPPTKIFNFTWIEVDVSTWIFTTEDDTIYDEYESEQFFKNWTYYFLLYLYKLFFFSVDYEWLLGNSLYVKYALIAINVHTYSM